MPSDRPPPEPRAPGSDPAGRRRTAAVRDGTLVFALVLGGFVAYALGASATYRATAVVTVEPAPGNTSVKLPNPADAVQILQRAALEPSLVATLAAEERATGSETPAQVASRIESTLSVESRDANSFAFSATAPSPERAQRVVNELAQQAARRATQVLDPQPQSESDPDPAARAKTELLDFLAAHPGIASEPSTVPSKPGRDPLILALRAERTRIEEKLATPAPSASDNPYDEPLSLENPTFLRRRLKEIDTALEARAKAAEAQASPKPDASASNLTPETRAEWQRLLRAVSEAKKPEPAAPPAPRLRVTLARAALPQLPIEPDRPRVVLLGVLVSSIVGILAGLLRGKMEARAVRRYGTTTARNPIASMPQTTLRLSREQLPKPLAPRADPPPTPVPDAPINPHPITPIPAAPLVPQPITSVPPAPLVPGPITPIPPAPLVPAPITPIPPRPRATAISPIPQAPLGPATITPLPPPATQRLPTPAPPAAAAPITPTPPAPVAAMTPTPPLRIAPATPIPPGGVPPPPETSAAMTPLVVQAPIGSGDSDSPPTTQGYGDAKKPSSPGRKAARRITQIYGTPPVPDFKGDSKSLRTTQAYGSPIAAIPPPPGGASPNNPTPYPTFPAEVLAPAHRNSVRPTPMIPVSKSSNPPPASVATRPPAPLAATSYSYVQTPVPESHSVSIPQTPPPRRPSPPPQTEPYGSIPPVQPRNPSSDPPVADAKKAKTPAPPAPAMSSQAIVKAHPVASNWHPDPTLTPARRRPLAAEILTLAVDRCLVVSVTGVRGAADKKSMAAAELALALAEAKQIRVLLVESDFQFPQVQKRLILDIPLSAGFSQQLRGRVDGARDGRWHVIECKPSLHVLAEGVMRSPGLLLSKQFEQALRDLRSGQYDVIVMDSPIAPGEADGQAIADVADGAIVVGPANRANEIVEVSRIFSGKKFLRVVES